MNRYRLLIVFTLLLSTGLCACEENTRWLTPEDSPERCKDGIDNDDNGKTDCQDEQCKQFDHCKSPVNPVPENTEELCKDGIDNDSNQKTDCQDESCKQFDNCKPPKVPVPEDTEDLCKDGIDNDSNQKTDCDEDACKKYEYCTESAESEPENTLELCTDGIDNDQNGKKDCLDDSCKEFESCKDENGNHMKDEFESGFESAEECNKHSKCASGFCDSFIGKCSVKCTSDDQCVSGFVCRQDGRCSSDTFESVWTFPISYGRLRFMDPTLTGGECDFVVDWGDGSAKETWTSCPTEDNPIVHIFVKAGTYHVKVTGKLTRWRPIRITHSLDYESTTTLKSIVSYGPVGLAAGTFDVKDTGIGFGNETRAIDLDSLSQDIDIPDPTDLGMNDNGERTLERMFYKVELLKSGVGKWDVSNITSIKDAFLCATKFNEDLTRWDTSNITDMSNAFRGCTFPAQSVFNANLSTWDTSKVTNMNSMLRQTSFKNNNGDIKNWDVSKVTDMENILYRAKIECDQLTILAESWNHPEIVPDSCNNQ